MTKPTKPSFDKPHRYASEAGASLQFCISRGVCGGCCHCKRPPASFHRPFVLATFCNRRAESTASLLDRPCLLYTSAIHAATKVRVADERTRSGKVNLTCYIFGALAELFALSFSASGRLPSPILTLAQPILSTGLHSGYLESF